MGRELLAQVLEDLRRDDRAADEEAAKVLQSPPLVIAVTVLTSIGETALPDIGVAENLGDHVVRLAALAQTAALDGVVASPREIALIRSHCGERFTVVTPGIRGLADLKGDQTRTESAQAALEAGASFIVVGRPIIAAPDPRAAAEAIANECRAVTRPILGG